MNRKELTKRVTSVLRENDVRKPVAMPKQVFHITDDEGNAKDFVIRKTDKRVIYTLDDVEAVIEAMVEVIKDALCHGERVTIRGFGTFGLIYRKARSTKSMYTKEKVDIAARYIPRFWFGKQLKMCGKLYELSLGDRILEDFIPEDYDDEDPPDEDGE